MQKKRVISFLPSATELIYELGAQEKLFGVTHECNYPCLLYTSPSPRDRTRSRMPSSA